MSFANVFTSRCMTSEHTHEAQVPTPPPSVPEAHGRKNCARTAALLVLLPFPPSLADDKGPRCRSWSRGSLDTTCDSYKLHSARIQAQQLAYAHLHAAFSGWHHRVRCNVCDQYVTAEISSESRFPGAFWVLASPGERARPSKSSTSSRTSNPSVSERSPCSAAIAWADCCMRRTIFAFPEILQKYSKQP